MDTRLGYAILASFLLHGMMIAVWPRMKPPQIVESVSLTGVSLIEGHPSLKPDDLQQKDVPSHPKKQEISNLGKRVTDQVMDGLGTRSWEKHKLSIPDIRLPKQAPAPDSEEYALIWAEEFPRFSVASVGADMAPIGMKGHKQIFSDSGLSETLLLEEFPEEKPIQQTPEITWKGTPRTWITKPDRPPSYQGEEEGLVKLRFWVNEKGDVVNAIPIQKLSVELEEKALAYIFAWRFEPSSNTSLQEGTIQITFRLDKQDR